MNGLDDQPVQKECKEFHDDTTSVLPEPRKMSSSSLHSSSSESEDPWYGWGKDAGEYEIDIQNDDEGESWTDLVEPIFLHRMNTKETKRQYIIDELIETEMQYVRTLLIMKKIYYDGMKKQLKISEDKLATIFPVLQEILDLNRNFLRDMKAEWKAQSNTESFTSRIGGVIMKHFGGENGQKFCEIYGYFCSRHHEAVAVFKAYCREYTNFKQFNEKCLSNFNAHRLSIPECITYMSMRLTKYPLLIQAIMKATPENNSDYTIVMESLAVVKQVLTGVEGHIDEYEKDKQLQKIRRQIDSLSTIKIKNKYGVPQLFQAYDIIPKTAKLLYDKNVKYRSGHRLYDIRMVIVTKKIIFFQKHPNTKKLQLLDVKNRPPVLLLQEVINPKENAAAARLADENAVFIITKSDIAEVLFDQKTDQRGFIEKLSEICDNNELNSTEEEHEEENKKENTSTDTEEKQKQMNEENTKQAKELISQLHDVDEKIRSHLHFKNKLVQRLQELFSSNRTVCESEAPVKTVLDKEMLNTRAKLEQLLTEVDDILIAGSSSENTSSELVNMNHELAETPSPNLKVSKNSVPNQESNELQRRGRIRTRYRSVTHDSPAEDSTDISKPACKEEPMLRKLSKHMRNLVKSPRNLVQSSRSFASDGDISSSSVSSPSRNKKLTCQDEDGIKRRSLSASFDATVRDSVSITGAELLEEPMLGNISKRGNLMRSSRLFASDGDISSVRPSPTLFLKKFSLPSSSNVQAYQHLSELLTSLIKLTNHQDLEIARMQEELLSYRDEQSVGEEEVSVLPEEQQMQEESERETWL